MEHFSFVFTIFFMLLGPVKLIPAFAGVTRGADEQYRRAAAVRGALIATAAVAVVALIGEDLLVKYRISIDAGRASAAVVGAQYHFPQDTAAAVRRRNVDSASIGGFAPGHADHRIACRRCRDSDIHDDDA